MESDTNDCNDSFGLIDVNSEEFNFLDSNDNWLTSNDTQYCKIKSTFDSKIENNVDINEWISNVFIKEKSKGVDMNLVNKLDELKLLSPNSSINTRTFTRQKRNNNTKRESLFKMNGTSLSTLYSPEDENESTLEQIRNTTFEVQTNKKSLNGTFTLKTADNTFVICNEDEMQMNNIDDVEKIAAIQEENLRQSCSNSSSPSRQRSPIRSHLSSNYNNNGEKRLSYLPNGNQMNSNTLTRNRGPLVRNSILNNALIDDLNPYPMVNEDEDNYHYQNGFSPDEAMFKASVLVHNSSTPVISRTGHNVNFSNDATLPVFAPKIMPNVTNLRSNSNQSKIGRSEPNLSKRLKPLNKGFPNCPSKSNHFGIMSSDNTYTNNGSTLFESKMPSDSRLVVKNGLMKKPFNYQIQAHNSGRITSPPPSQTQQQLVGKVTVEGEFNRNGTTSTTTNLCRKSTFRVRDYSEENLREKCIDLCNTNSNTITNGYQTNNNNNAKQSKVQRNVSKIPGPKSRSGIPVSGVRTVIPVPVVNNTNHRPADHTGSNSWKNGCF